MTTTVITTVTTFTTLYIYRPTTSVSGLAPTLSKTSLLTAADAGTASSSSIAPPSTDVDSSGRVTTSIYSTSFPPSAPAPSPISVSSFHNVTDSPCPDTWTKTGSTSPKASEAANPTAANSTLIGQKTRLRYQSQVHLIVPLMLLIVVPLIAGAALYTLRRFFPKQYKATDPYCPIRQFYRRAVRPVLRLMKRVRAKNRQIRRNLRTRDQDVMERVMQDREEKVRADRVGVEVWGH